MAQHTPGPWTDFRDEESHDIIARGDGSHIARMEPCNGLDPLAEKDANARLIAAAPDLLAALRRLATRVLDDGDVIPLSNAAAALALIAKVEGGP